MRTSPTGLDLIKHFEGLELESYQDIAGIWTIGYGHTGDDVYPDQHISFEQADALLRQDLERFEAGINRLVKVDIDQNQFDALISLSYNIGLGAFGSSTVLKRLNKGDHHGAAEAITWWNKATVNGQKREVAGLTRRRAAEKALFLQNIAAGESGSDKADSSRVQPVEDSPRRGNLSGSRTLEGSAVAGAGGAAGAGAGAMADADEKEASNPTSDSDGQANEAQTDNPLPADASETEDTASAETDTPAATDPTDVSPSTDATTAEVTTSSVDNEGFTREDYKDIFQFVAAAIVILAVLYIVYARIDDWLKYKR